MAIRIEFAELTFGHAQLLTETINSFQNEIFRTGGSVDHEQQSGTDISLKGDVQTCGQIVQDRPRHDEITI